MASIGLTIPAIAVASIWLDGPLVLGLGATADGAARDHRRGRRADRAARPGDLLQGGVHLVLSPRSCSSRSTPSHDEPARPAGRRQPSPTGCGSPVAGTDPRVCAKRPTRCCARAGRGPWSSGPLMVRAERLGSLTERRNVAAGLRALVQLVEYQRSGSRYLVVRQRPVLEEARDARCAGRPARSPATRRGRRRRAAPSAHLGFGKSGVRGRGRPGPHRRGHPPRASSGLHRRRRERRQPTTESPRFWGLRAACRDAKLRGSTTT